jgi:HD-like signal output (HDOD) protein
LFNIERLPASPQIIPQLQKLVEDGDQNPDDVLDAIKLDPALAARVLQACNSAAFASASRVDNIPEAVTRLGFTEVYHIVCLSVLRDGFPRTLRSYRTTAEAIWHQSLTAAFLMEAFVRDGSADSSAAYTLGLLHRVGMFFIDQHLAGQDEEVRFQPDDPAYLEWEENEVVGFSSAEAGSLAMEAWGFPPSLFLPVRFQGDPCGCQDFPELARKLNLASNVACLLDQGDTSSGGVHPLVVNLLRSEDEGLMRLVDEVRRKVSRVEAAFGL